MTTSTTATTAATLNGNLATTSNNNTFKVCVIGDAGSGKTSLVKRFQYGVFNASQRTTVGVEFSQKALVVDGNNVTVRLWDVAGQESTRNASRTYYQGAVGAFVVVDGSNPLSMDASLRWKADLDEKTTNSKFNLVDQTINGSKYPSGQKRLPCFLLLNKCDLGVSIGKTKQQLEALCQKHGIQGYFETSAATGENTMEALETLVRSMVGVSSQSEANNVLSDGNATAGGNGGRNSGEQSRGRIVLGGEKKKDDGGACSKC
jgi:small GTP-binding protein